MPAAVVPMTAVARLVVGNHHQVEGARGDSGLTAGADIRLASGVRLDRSDRYPQIAHTSNSTTTTMVPMTIT